MTRETLHMLSRWGVLRRALGASTGVALLAIAIPAMGQDCVRVESSISGATITLGSNVYLSSSSPGIYCSLEPGRTYSLALRASGYERRTMKLKIRSDGTAKASRTQSAYLGRSLVLPGWGLGAQGAKDAGMSVFLDFFATGLSAYQSYRSWEAEKQNRDYYSYLRLLNTDSAADSSLAYRVQLHTQNASAYEDNLIYTSIFTGWWYLGGLIETFYLSQPPSSHTSENGAIVISTPRVSGFRAALHSMFWPGMGQYYYGSPTKGFFMQSGFVLSGLILLDRKLSYDLRVIDYDNAVDQVLAAKTDTEKAQKEFLRNLKADSRDKARTQMYVWAGITGGVWLINVVDAAINGGKHEFPGHFEPETSYRNGSFYTGLRVAF